MQKVDKLYVNIHTIYVSFPETTGIKEIETTSVSYKETTSVFNFTSLS
jgi:hypothetical protein